jgi:hypothetical protein
LGGWAGCGRCLGTAADKVDQANSQEYERQLVSHLGAQCTRSCQFVDGAAIPHPLTSATVFDAFDFLIIFI